MVVCDVMIKILIMPDLSSAVCSCQASLTPGHLLTEPPTGRSCGPHDQTLLLCR